MPEHHLHVRGYVCYWKDTDDGFCAHGDVAILVHNSIHLQEITLQSTLPAVAVKVIMTHLSLIDGSLYLPPGQPLFAPDLFDLFSEFPTSWIIVRDFNAHNPVWSCSRTCQRGALLEQLFLANLILLHWRTNTHLHVYRFCMFHKLDSW